MRKEGGRRKKRKKSGKGDPSPENSFALHGEILQLKKRIQEISETLETSEEKIQDIEIHVNLLTRLITTLCIEKFGMRIGVLKRLIKRIEKEAIRDSQILHLEALYKLPHQSDRKGSSSHPPAKNDPWEDIS